MNPMKIQRKSVLVKRLHPDAVIPKYARVGDAGFDLVATEGALIMPGDTIAIHTGLAFGIPEGFEIQIRPRSGLSAKTNMRVANSPGTIDCGYRGEVKVLIQNTGNGVELIAPGDRIAQGVLSEVPMARFEEVDELDETERGTGGFGSTGVQG